jgi:phosphate transport system substrate-binding protein
MKTSLLLAVAAWACLVSGIQAQQTLRIRGSDTLGAKLVPQLAEQFKLSHGRQLSFDIAAEGSSTAFTNLASDTADIGMSSRRIKAEETRFCESKGIVLREMEIAWDLIVIVVNEDNPVTNLTRQQVRQIFTGEIRDWSELEGKPGRVSAYTRNTSSGAYKDFMSLALGDLEYGTRTQKMAGNEQIAAEVGANVNGVGYVGYAYADAKGVRIVSIDGVLPVPAMVNSYAFSRPTYLYTRGEPAGMVKAFMDYINTPAGDVIVSSCGFVPKSKVL